MSTENWLDFLAISMDPRKADGLRFTINLVTPDNGETHLVEMSNATLTNIKGRLAKNPDLTITVNRTDLNQVMMGASTFDDLINAGKAKFEGDRKPFDQLRGLMVSFAPNFEILPGPLRKLRRSHWPRSRCPTCCRPRRPATERGARHGPQVGLRARVVHCGLHSLDAPHPARASRHQAQPPEANMNRGGRE